MRQGAGGQERGQALWRAKGANPQAPSPSPHPPQNEHKAQTHTHTHTHTHSRQPTRPPYRPRAPDECTEHAPDVSATATSQRRLGDDVSGTFWQNFDCVHARTHATPRHAPHAPAMARTPRTHPTRGPHAHPTPAPHARTPRTHPAHAPNAHTPTHAPQTRPHSRIPRTHTTHAHHATPCRATHAPHACTNAHTHARTPRAHAHVHAHAHAHTPPLRPNLLLWSTSRRTNWWRRALVKLVLRCTLGRSVLGLF